jgi:thiamine-phosphate pyrophosphorylase
VLPPNRPIGKASGTEMASRGNRREATRPAARLYLATPQIADLSDFAPACSEALAAVEVAAVLLRLAPADTYTLVDRVRSLAPLVQERGVALVLDRHQDIVAQCGADGAHLTGIDQFRAALPALKPERIAGCGGLASRHDAMVGAEAGADYVMFGEPDAAQRRPSFPAILERIAWWAELFEVPCVGYAANTEEVAPLAAAGADFVALGEWIFARSTGHRGPAAAITDAARRLATAELAA